MILALILVITGSVVSASAEDFDHTSRWINVFDYNPDLSHDFNVMAGSPRVLWFNLPFETRLYYLDMVIFTSFKGDFDFYTGTFYSDELIGLKVIPIGDRLFRIHGNIYSAHYDPLKLAIFSDGDMYGNIVSFSVSTQHKTTFSDIGSLSISSPGISFSDTMTSASDNILWSDRLTINNQVYAVLKFPNWQKYDLIDVVISTTGLRIDSISAMCDGVGLDVEQNLIEVGSYGGTYINLRIDFRGIGRTNSSPPVLYVSGLGFDQCSFGLDAVTGYVFTEIPDADVYWLSRIFDNITNLHDGIESWFSSLGSSIGNWFGQLKVWLADGFKSVTDKLDLLVNGSEDQQQAADDMKDNFGSFNDSAGSFEEGAIDGIQNNFGEVSAGFDFVNIATPLAFVATYLNGAFSSLGQYSVVIMLPIFAGIVLFVLSRVPGSMKPRNKFDISPEEARRVVEGHAAWRASRYDDGLEFDHLG